MWSHWWPCPGRWTKWSTGTGYVVHHRSRWRKMAASAWHPGQDLHKTLKTKPIKLVVETSFHVMTWFYFANINDTQGAYSVGKQSLLFWQNRKKNLFWMSTWQWSAFIVSAVTKNTRIFFKLWFWLNDAFLLTTITCHQDYSRSDNALMSCNVTLCHQDRGNVTLRILFSKIKMFSQTRT